MHMHATLGRAASQGRRQKLARAEAGWGRDKLGQKQKQHTVVTSSRAPSAGKAEREKVTA